uniref:Enoyl-CoA hydratase/isomerase-like protein n=1 Tax=Chondromyces crocatus TaxID=52 RepID=A0A089VKY3_CHOCO|nr:enoyl-CoA hydratase/isomerase-like protein [Chondromyces crocatus]
MTSVGERVRAVREGSVTRVTLTHPSTGNALDCAALEQLVGALRAAVSDAACRALVVSSVGPRFCSGADVFTQADDAPEREASMRAFVECMTLLCASSMPTIACVEGDALGGGVGLAAACDIVLASEEVTFTLSEVIFGMIPALITPFLLRRLTLGRLRYMMVSSRAIPAREAREAGLVDEVVPGGEMEATLARQLGRIGRSSPPAIATGKAYLDGFGPGGLEARTSAAMALQQEWLKRPEVMEGIQMFADGFSPPWFEKLGRAGR